VKNLLFTHPLPPLFRGEFSSPCLLKTVFYLLALPPHLVPIFPAITGTARTLPSIKRGLRGVFL